MALSDADTIALARSLWPALTTDAASDVFLTSWLSPVRGMVSAFTWGTQYDYGVAHLLAHYAYKADPAGLLGSGGAAGGPVSGVSTGRISVSYAATSSGVVSVDQLSSTAPGQAYLQLRASRPGVMFPITA